MNSISADIKSSANEAALLNIMMYLDIEDVRVNDGWNVKDIVDDLGSIYASENGYDKFKQIHKEELEDKSEEEILESYKYEIN